MDIESLDREQMKKEIAASFQNLKSILDVFKTTSDNAIISAINLIYSTFTQYKKLLICGNGGSAADAQHFAAEFVNVFDKNVDRRPLPAISLSADSSIITAIANDTSYNLIFARQIQALGNSGDTLICFSTSGASKNCIEAVKAATSLGLNTISFTRTNSHLAKISQISIEAPSTDTQQIQELHLITYHLIAGFVEKLISSENGQG